MAMNFVSKIQKLIRYLKAYKSFNLKNYMGNINLNLGCGNKPLEGFINVDYYNTKYADIVFDLNKKFPFDSESVDLVFSDNVFEHIDDIFLLMNECNRVLKKGGYLIIKVPYFKSKHAFVDFTHKHFFTIQSLDYWIKDSYFYSLNQYLPIKGVFEEKEIFFDPENKKLFKGLIAFYATRKPNFFENSIWSNIFVFHNIIYVLRK